jgi:hypothetical protein
VRSQAEQAVDEVPALEILSWGLWSPDSCDQCIIPDDTGDLWPQQRLVSINSLREGQELVVGHVGCIRLEDVPTCDVDSKMENPQAGGHAGTFHVLRENRVAKLSEAFDSSVSKAKQHAAGTEYNFYMQLWCLGALRQAGHFSGTHLLDPFQSAWAPKFYGVCRWVDAAFLVMQNVFAGYKKASQLDLKVGLTVAGNEPQMKKLVTHTIGDELTPTGRDGARLAGFKIWNGETSTYEGMYSKTLSQFRPLPWVFDKYLGTSSSNPQFEKCVSAFGDQLAQMFKWWNRHGTRQIRSIAASLLFVYEGDDTVSRYGGAVKAPTLYFIDFAHFFPAVDQPELGEDHVEQGLASAIREIDRLAPTASRPAVDELDSYTKICGVADLRTSGNNMRCMEKCATPSVNAENEQIKGLPLSLCQSLADDKNYAFFGWRRVAEVSECRLCNSTTPRKFRTIQEPWLFFKRKSETGSPKQRFASDLAKAWGF